MIKQIDRVINGSRKGRRQAKRKPVRNNATLRRQLLRNHFGLREEQKVVSAPGFRVCP
jgi:hypothetical protein